MAESVKALRSQRHLEVEGEDFFQKAKRKIKEEPFINLGVAGTVIALLMATRQYRRGARKSMNQWLRFRVAAQGFTLVAICSYGFHVRHQRAKAAEAGEELAPHMQSVNDRQASKEKFEFQKRLDDAVRATKLEESKLPKDDGKPVNWREAWKAGVLKKNAENDEKRIKPSER